MIFKVLLLTMLVLNLSITSVVAQHQHNHSHERNEIGISPGATYSTTHKEWGLGIHAHYFRTLGDHSKWSIGTAVETILGNNKHYNISVGAKYQLFPKLSVGMLPGISFIKHSDSNDGQPHSHDNDDGVKSQFSAHFELVYDLITHKYFHLGPAIDYSLTKNDSHVMLGIHFAICF